MDAQAKRVALQCMVAVFVLGSCLVLGIAVLLHVKRFDRCEVPRIPVDAIDVSLQTNVELEQVLCKADSVRICESGYSDSGDSEGSRTIGWIRRQSQVKAIGSLLRIRQPRIDDVNIGRDSDVTLEFYQQGHLLTEIDIWGDGEIWRDGWTGREQLDDDCLKALAAWFGRTGVEFRQ